MITTIKPKAGGTPFRVKVVTQQYGCGLYIAMYRGDSVIPLQETSTMKEKAYHKLLRKKHDWEKGESTVL